MSEMEDLHTGTKTQIARLLLKKLRAASTQTESKFVSDMDLLTEE